MFKFDSRLLFFTLVLGALALMVGCSQTDDITAPKSVTKVWLSADRLPTPVPGMAYELWASKVAIPEITDVSEVRSAGKFSFMSSDALVTFLEPRSDTQIVRADSNLFVFEGDLFDFEYLFISIENESASDTLPGPAMLMQPITGNTDTLEMHFPQHDSLFRATIRCNFETPTDGHPGADGYGLWFSAYEYLRIQIVDTHDVEISYVDSTIEPVYDTAGNILNLATLYGSYPDSVWVEFDTVQLDFGLDTLALGLDIDGFTHYGAERKIIYEIDSTSIPRTIKAYDIIWDTTVSTVYLDVFTQDMYALPDLTEYGWKYKGWIVSEAIPEAAIGEFTPPAWDFITGELLIPGYGGGLLTTGTFADVTRADDSNPFTLEIPWEVDSGTFIDTVLKRPNLPGEDFLDAAALSAATGGVIDAPPYLFADYRSSIFVSIEPVNMATDTTNFPLIAFCFASPGFWPNANPNGGALLWTLLNWTGSAPGSKGFPVVTAEIQRL